MKLCTCRCNCAELEANYASLAAQFRELEERVSRLPSRLFIDPETLRVREVFKQWVYAQTAPFTVLDVMDEFGLDEALRTRTVELSWGLKLFKLGCHSERLACGKLVYHPPVIPCADPELRQQLPHEPPLATQSPEANSPLRPEGGRFASEARAPGTSHQCRPPSDPQGDELPPTHLRSASRSAVLFARQPWLAAPLEWMRATLARITGRKP